MPAVQMPRATALAVVGPDAKMDIHAGLQRHAHLDQIEMRGQSTDISVGMTTVATTPTSEMSDTTGITRWRVPALWRKGWARVSLRRAMRVTTSTGSTIKMSWTAKVLQVRHASGLGS